MHLLNTSTLELETFNNRDPSTLPYAILSHVWEHDDDEVTFQDFQSASTRRAVQHKPGYQKIARFCSTISSLYPYAWVDTACIDKKSSAELSEAINSMYFWYRDARACYAYLRDVTHSCAFSPCPNAPSLRLSTWHARGWTLQELIAPRTVIFMDRNWTPIGTKHTLQTHLATITGIHATLLSNTTPLSHFNTAQKLSWAASRHLTRPEDVAYSLVGLFEISLDIRYGEGAARAFLRLQQEILRNSSDASIFAWTRQDEGGDGHPGLLAPSPAPFAGCGHTVTRAPRSDYESQFFRYENGAVATRLRMRPVGGTSDEVYQAVLEGFKVQGRRSGIFLQKLRDGDQYRRVTWRGRSGVLISEDAWERALRNWRSYQLVRVSVPQKMPSPSRNLDMRQQASEVVRGRFARLRLVAAVRATARLVLWKLGL